MSNTHPRLLVLSMVVAGLALAGCNNRQVENQPDAVSTMPPPTIDPMNEPMAPVEPMPDPMMQDDGPSLMVMDVLRTPNDWVGKTLSGTAMVPEAPTDRGFWLEVDGQRIFAIVDDYEDGDAFDVSQGQTVKITDATVRDPSYLTSVSGDLAEETQQLARSQQVYLVVNHDDIEVVNQGTMPGMPTDPMRDPMDRDPMDPMDPMDPVDPMDQDPMGQPPVEEEPIDPPNPIQ